MTCCRNDIKTFARLGKALVDLLLASAKDPATSAKNVRRKTCAGNRITQGESAKYPANHVALALNASREDSVGEISKDILTCLPCIDCPALNAHTNVAHEKILEIDATPPRVISFDVAIIYPISSCESVCAPKRDVEFPIRVPLRAGRWSNLF